LQKPVSFSEMQSRFPNQWLLVAEPIMKEGKVIEGIVLFHDADKRNLAVANQNAKLTKQFKSATHIFTGTLPKESRIGIFKQVANFYD